MRVLWHPSDTAREFVIPANYHQMYRTTALSCECPEHQGAPRSRCMHIELERFISDTNREVLGKITRWRCDGNPGTALKLKLGMLEEILRHKERAALNPCATYITRRMTTTQAAWLHWQVEMLRRRVDFVDRIKGPVHI